MLISNRIKNLNPYVPGEQPKDRVYIKLNANENPYPPSPAVQKAVMDFIKVLFRTNNRTGCRFLIVDALNCPATLHYYEKNGFRYLIDDERLEAKYMGIGVGRLPLNTRLMYFDLLKLNVSK